MSEISWETANLLKIRPALDFRRGFVFLGTVLPMHKTKMVKNKETKEEEPVPYIENTPAILAAKGKFREIWEVDDDLTVTGSDIFRVLTLPNTIDKWRAEDMKNFLGLSEEKHTLLETYDSIKLEISKYIEFSDDREYDLVTCWALATYFHPLFSAFPFLFLNGPKQCGKTKLLMFLSEIAFNGVLTLNQTPANLFRMTQELQPTFLIDETDKYAKGEQSDFRSLLLARYKQGSCIYRIEEKQKGRSVQRSSSKFEVYGPTALANIRGLDDVLSDRTINITLKRSVNPAIANNRIDLTEEKWSGFRNMSYITLFSYANQVSFIHNLFNELLKIPHTTKNITTTEESNDTDEYTNFYYNSKNKKVVDNGSSGGVLEKTDIQPFPQFPTDFPLENFIDSAIDNETAIKTLHEIVNKVKNDVVAREAELWLPIFTIALMRSEETLRRMISLSSDKTKEKHAVSQDYTLEAQVLPIMWKSAEVAGFFEIKTITDELNKMIKSENENARGFSGKSVSTILSRLGFKTRGKSSSGRATVYLKRGDIEDVSRRLKIDLEYVQESVEVIEPLPDGVPEHPNVTRDKASK